MSFDSIVNRGDYFSAHYLAEILPKDLKKKGGLLARWAEEEKAGRTTPRRGLRALSKPYFADRPFFSEFDVRRREGEPLNPDDVAEWRKELNELHGDILRALGYQAQPRELTVERGNREHTVHVAHADRQLAAIECGWASTAEAAIAGELLAPVQLDNREWITAATKLASWLLNSDIGLRYVIILAGGVIILADRATWGDGRYLAVNLDVALSRNNQAELDLIAALFGADSLLPPEEGGSDRLTELLSNSRQHAVGVDKELRRGIQSSVELIANEVLNRIRQAKRPSENGMVPVQPEDIMEPGALAKELGREALRYLYRILFLLYAEARPELGILPTDDEDYGKGYSLARLGDLVVRDLVGEEAKQSFHLYESLDLLFRMVNKGHRQRAETVEETSEGEGLRFEPLRSDLFEPSKTKLIGRDAILVPGYSKYEDAPRIDTRLRNEVLYQVLRNLMLTKGKKNERGGFISYAQLGINQLGAVYEGLMSYTGFISTEELYEVAKKGDDQGGTWTIPASKIDDYPDDVKVYNPDTGGLKHHAKGAFVYRLAGRDRQTSASYYTPESLTQVTVELALKHRLDQDGATTTAQEILGWKICEPALGSGAFLNEAINQVATEYLKRRQRELGVVIDPERYEEEWQKAKAYIALHNSYGVDLNETAIELAEVSLWLNVMYPGLQAPWFGLHLRRGNSLIGAGRRLYGPAALTTGEWLKTAPEDLPFSAGERPEGKVHHFLLPAEGWGAVAGAKEAKELAPDQAKQLAAWGKKIRGKVSEKRRQGQKLTQLQRLQALSGRAEYLWGLVVQRLSISEREISRKIDVWGADWIEQPADAVTKEKVYGDLVAPGTPYWRLKTVMDAWCALWFWPLDRVGLLDGSDDVYVRLVPAIPAAAESLPTSVDVRLPETEESIGFWVQAQEPLFPVRDEQLGLDGLAQEIKETKTSRPKPARKRTALEPLRPVIPLADLDDWLDFAEAVLGRVDIDYGETGAQQGFATTFTTLDEMEHHEDDVVGWMRMESPGKIAERFPWLHTVEVIAKEQGFFHWELQFAQIANAGGFDLQVGNPPWVRPQWDELGVLAEFEPWFKLAEKASVAEKSARRGVALESVAVRGAFLRERAQISGTVTFFKSIQTFPLIVGTQPDLYRAFMSRTWANAAPAGIIGLIHPDTHFTGEREAALREAAYRRLLVHGDFVNPGHRFFPEPVGESTHFGVHIYGAAGEIGFDHLSWLFSVEALRGSAAHDGAGDPPGVRYRGALDERPHRSRIVRVDHDVLAQWQRLTGETDLAVEQTRLLSPVSTAEAAAIQGLADYPIRLGQFESQVSSGYHESGAKDAGLITYDLSSPGDWAEVILKGVQLGLATPLFKSPTAGSNDVLGLNLMTLDPNEVPETEYRRVPDRQTYESAQDLWTDFQLLERLSHDPAELAAARTAVAEAKNKEEGAVSDQEVRAHLIRRSQRRYTEFYRMAWRKMIAPDTERSLYVALLPPGPSHIDGIRSAVVRDRRQTSLTAGFWSSIPLDYFLRTNGTGNLDVSSARLLPVPAVDHRLADALLLRTLRLNCLTTAYSDLWEELYEDAWQDETWACAWDGLPALGEVGPVWDYTTPLRSERSRRAALVELDALVAVWMGIDVDALIAMYRARFPVMNRFEEGLYFDAEGWKLAANHRTIGQIQRKEHYEQLTAHLDPEINGPVPDGYTAPFYKADREAEYRQAHAVFSEWLRQAQAAQERDGEV
ncbi:class I SAM-dependent DNA methyltransferase [Nonomuraea sp. LP-02]|uniref:class I SAM-dependent DNA methyltransferase n=1 Tax=Nonomuraea sp. LP-02 TaxID=3097960 RepID=UPI002E37E0F0|nr:class I SAM-dependent DNA methyltransferase [Nonomuraea sp. LP-02]MED7928825.1 class I SAM-dependent DNA methyltransferase [Nonomuraea sp. LP-02]